ncbi:MAG: ErfK/YbiS/YcfS/YnhG family protein [uncultured Sulfurovum sp.]|uniref:ErfK/YbiS/YcfS/YnhG family protein n=1 Tax=uncultured Sulfurovum sp. TaxID=269237 RepID=A0A6S6U2V9_9BACT|nr:MAG: ErfK/YbiS/YcfS/YnhG family protein [uncultured Sulfurovum sp.]
MKNYVWIIMLMVLGGCSQKVNPPPVPIVLEHNVTIENNVSLEEQEEEIVVVVPELNIFDWQQNDELIKSEKAVKMVVVKSKRVLVLLNTEGDVLSRHRISLGDNPVGTKLKRGDKKTPEGTYGIRDIRGDKKYYKEILISYPNAEDKKRSKDLGFHPGSGITFHAQVPWNWNGSGDDYTLSNDWTNGCLALTNHGMDTVLAMIDKNTVVEIRE